MAESLPPEELPKRFEDIAEALKLAHGELAVLKSALIDQSVTIEKLLVLQRLLLDKAGYDPQRIHDLLIKTHEDAKYRISKELGLNPKRPRDW